MYKTAILIFIQFLSFFEYSTSHAQSKLTNRQNEQIQLPMESVFVHYNNTLLLTGEYLYYSLFCLNNKTGELSELSKIGYVELIDITGKTIFKHKLRLESGRGQGDFFIPTTVQSGNYKLFGYTQLMRNGAQKNFFQADLSIVNPYSSSQSVLLKKPIENKNLLHSSEKDDTNIVNQTEVGRIKFVDGRQTFEKREKITIFLEEITKSIDEGSFSISVRKLDFKNIPKAPISKNLYTKTNNSSKLITMSSTISNIPEIRGELISGEIIARKRNLEISKLKLAISVPGPNYDFKIINSNEKGEFYYILDDNCDGESLVINLLEDTDSYEVKIKEQEPLDISKVDFNRFLLDESMEKKLLDRSIYNQIENNYFAFKPDSVKTFPKKIPFYGNLAEQYILNDYTRFRTVEETIIEILDNVYVERLDDGNPSIQVRSDYASNDRSGFPPLIIVDGNYIQDFNDLLKYDANKIEKISVVTNRYVLGPQVFEGIIDIVTFEGNYSDTYINKHAFSYDLVKPLPKKYYFNQNYDNIYLNDSERLPDFRQQLLWNPNFRLDKNTSEISFYSSDVSGDFEISIEGFLNNGKPISLREIFRVE